MLDSTLTWIEVPGPVDRAELRAFSAALRRSSRLAGFQQYQTFRGIDSTEILLVLARWKDEKAAGSGLRAAALRGDSVALATDYDLELLRRAPSATLLRATRGDKPLTPQERAADRELALRAMAAPGTLRITCARSKQRDSAACRVDFDCDDALWHFLESPTRHAWAELAERSEQREVWALNLPRFSLEQAPELEIPPAGRSDTETVGQLSLELTVLSPRSARILLNGRMDAHGAERFKSVAESLFRQGCRSLALDIRRLEGLDPAAMSALLAVVRQLKALGGQVDLLEQEKRFARTTRLSSLHRSFPRPKGGTRGAEDED